MGVDNDQEEDDEDDYKEDDNIDGNDKEQIIN